MFVVFLYESVCKTCHNLMKKVLDLGIIVMWNPPFSAEDEHDVVWFWLENGKPHECPVCTQYFEVSWKSHLESVDDTIVTYRDIFGLRDVKMRDYVDWKFSNSLDDPIRSVCRDTHWVPFYCYPILWISMIDWSKIIWQLFAWFLEL